MDGLSSVLRVRSLLFLCPYLQPSSLDLSADHVYRYFLDNQVTKDHASLIFGVRELNSTELTHFCSNQSMNRTLPIPHQPFHFTSDYQLQIYTSGCYYLDEINHQWRSDGLLVSFSHLFSIISNIVLFDNTKGGFDDKCE